MVYHFAHVAAFHDYQASQAATKEAYAREIEMAIWIGSFCTY